MASKLTPLLTTADVAELLNAKEAWVRERCAAGDIPAFKIGTRWRIDRGQFDSWLERQRFVPATSPLYESAPPVPSSRGSISDLLEKRAARNTTESATE